MSFSINKNLAVLIKIVTRKLILEIMHVAAFFLLTCMVLYLSVDCCVNKICWCFTTKGMCTIGQDEVIVVLECLPDENTAPMDVFRHLSFIYDEASKGT